MKNDAETDFYECQKAYDCLQEAESQNSELLNEQFTYSKVQYEWQTATIKVESKSSIHLNIDQIKYIRFCLNLHIWES